MGAGRNKGSKAIYWSYTAATVTFISAGTQFDRVLATEIVKLSVAAPRNTTLPLTILITYKLFVWRREEFTQAMNGVREFNRLQGNRLKELSVRNHFVDPPRSGLTVKPRKWCRRIHVFGLSPEIRKRYARIWNIKPDAARSNVWLYLISSHAPYGVRRITDREVKPCRMRLHPA